jgi:hypothetical protein
MPRLIVPSSGGGRKLIRTLRAGTGVAVGIGDGEGVALGVSCACVVQIDVKRAKIAALTIFVIPSEVEESLTVILLLRKQ